MEENGVIVDTSVWIEYFKTFSDTSLVVRRLIEKRTVIGIGLVLAELLQGVKTSKEEEDIIESFEGIKFLEIDKSSWIKAGQMALSLRKKGIVLPLTDVIIAVMAIENNCSLFTFDKHFQHIPGLKLFKEIQAI